MQDQPLIGSVRCRNKHCQGIYIAVRCDTSKKTRNFQEKLLNIRLFFFQYNFEDEGSDPKSSSDCWVPEEEVSRAAALQAHLVSVRAGGEGCCECGGCALSSRCLQRSARPGRDTRTHQLAARGQSGSTPPERRSDETTRGTGTVKLITFVYCFQGNTAYFFFLIIATTKMFLFFLNVESISFLNCITPTD